MGLTQHQPTPARRHFMMTSPRAQAAFHHQQFFFEQKDKLAHLLNTIGADARNATTISLSSSQAPTPTTSSDYHELLTVTTHLLSEAQTLSTWTFDMVESNGAQVEPFAEKVALVERIAGELRGRVLQLQQQQMQHLTNTTTPPPNPVGPRSCNPTLSAASKKRSRACCDDDDDDEDGVQQQQSQQQSNPLPPLSYKRSRVFHHHHHPQQQQQQQPQPQQQELMSGIEPTPCGTHAERFLQTPWWVQRPICD
ncbi:hypothetical protein D0863_16310 [Hortaea werneckii]|uniref:Uncharacterized protein n=1 Tax=Hortaea werneckii TaxID=91943 RepID=A0A3M7BV02_HORWE|nr:hypothetical protein D0863_16310 [Hortaea werneckii]